MVGIEDKLRRASVSARNRRMNKKNYKTSTMLPPLSDVCLLLPNAVRRFAALFLFRCINRGRDRSMVR